jgi:hypothetical protein
MQSGMTAKIAQKMAQKEVTGGLSWQLLSLPLLCLRANNALLMGVQGRGGGVLDRRASPLRLHKRWHRKKNRCFVTHMQLCAC